MPGAKVASTGRTDGPLLQKLLPQSSAIGIRSNARVHWFYTPLNKVFCKTYFSFWYPSEDQLCGQVLLLYLFLLTLIQIMGGRSASMS